MNVIFEKTELVITINVKKMINLIYIPTFEEKGVLKRFGEEFILYKREVNGWIPKLKAYDPIKTHNERS